MARCLHIPALVLSAGMYACVVPPPLGLDQPDAGADAAPVLVSIRGPDGKELTQPDAISIIAHIDASWTITAYDSDAGDTLLVQVFLDYRDADPSPPRSTCTAAPSAGSSLDRTLTCPINAICRDEDVLAGNPHFLTFEVYDRPVIDTPRFFRSVPSTGQLSEKSFLVNCTAPTAVAP